MTNHNDDTPTARFLTPEQIARLTALVDSAIFSTTSHLVSAVKHPCDRRNTVELATLIESDRRLKTFLSTLA